MTTDMTAPATKQDIAMLMEQIGQYYVKTERQISSFRQEMISDMMKWKEELKLYFDVSVENTRHDALGANRDEIDNLKIRVGRLERHARFKTA